MKNRDGESWDKLPSPTSVSDNDDWGVAAKEDSLLLWGSINGTEVADEKTLEELLELKESGGVKVVLTEGGKK